ncbi:DUF4169 family protein [Brevundimonas sp.]|uniref:DUF4169 family protein n=2 Tax=unclassified Brevundimonas TaxID=2622653 RepID=UPI0028A261BE|nr:DUF4169 family protein [Brevundimonas sp.]
MGNVVNLNRFRKQAERQKDKARAETNRLLYGRSKSEKIQTETEREQSGRRLDGHKLTPED